MLERERLNDNQKSLREVINTRGKNLSGIDLLYDFVLPIMQENVEALLSLLDDIEGGGGEEGETQAVEISVSTYSEVSQTLSYLCMDESIPRDLRRAMLQMYGMLKSEVDGVSVNEVIQKMFRDATTAQQNIEPDPITESSEEEEESEGEGEQEGEEKEDMEGECEK